MENVVGSERTVPSSPSAAVFSDELRRTSSPASSPPGFPWETKSTTSMNTTTIKPAETAFSVLGKRKALESISDNAQPKKKAAIHPRKAPAHQLTQMQISLGQEVQKKCKTCGMEYIASSAEDRKLHDKYHKQNTEGYDVGKDFVQKTCPPGKFKGVRDGDAICRLNGADRPTRKRRGQAVLEIVQRELGAVEIPEDTVWKPNAELEFDWLAYLYVRGSKCIGFLLVHKIKEAYRVVEPSNTSAGMEPQEKKVSRMSNAREALKTRQEAEAKRLEELSKQPIELSQDPTPAILGISRIWTSAAHRQQQIARKLLDTAVADHNAHVAHCEKGDAESKIRSDRQGKGFYEKTRHLFPRSPKVESLDDVAFSQPTEAGARLARKWFGKMFGWKVYMD